VTVAPVTRDTKCNFSVTVPLSRSVVPNVTFTYGPTVGHTLVSRHADVKEVYS
jgi:hypothetical protein